jgi:hypothetical protein
MKYRLLFVIIIVVLIGVIGGYLVFSKFDKKKEETEEIVIDLTKSSKLTNVSMDLYNSIEPEEGMTVFYFYTDCPHFTEDVLIKDVQDNYYYLPEKDSIIIIKGPYEWTKEPTGMKFYMSLLSMGLKQNLHVPSEATE